MTTLENLDPMPVEAFFAGAMDASNVQLAATCVLALPGSERLSQDQLSELARTMFGRSTIDADRLQEYWRLSGGHDA